MTANPVMFPPGRARLDTCPTPTGSACAAKTMGIVLDARRAAENRAYSLDHLVGAREDRRRDRQTERIGGLQIDDESVFGSLLYGQVRWFHALQDLVDVGSGTPGYVGKVRRIAHEPPASTISLLLNIPGNRCFNASSARSA